MTLDAIVSLNLYVYIYIDISPFKQYYDLHFLLPKRLGFWTFRSGIEVELAQLRQEIATERAERQALARLVDSLVTKVSWKKNRRKWGKTWFGWFIRYGGYLCLLVIVWFILFDFFQSPAGEFLQKII